MGGKGGRTGGRQGSTEYFSILCHESLPSLDPASKAIPHRSDLQVYPVSCEHGE